MLFASFLWVWFSFSFCNGPPIHQPMTDPARRFHTTFLKIRTDTGFHCSAVHQHSSPGMPPAGLEQLALGSWQAAPWASTRTTTCQGPIQPNTQHWAELSRESQSPSPSAIPQLHLAQGLPNPSVSLFFWFCPSTEPVFCPAQPR